MFRAALLSSALALSLASPPQAPPVQNGRVETRQTAAIDRELTALAAAAREPVWAGWRVPIADGQRGGCCLYSDDAVTTRGCLMEGGSIGRGQAPPTPAASTTPVPLEAGTGLVILARLTDRGLERLRTLGDDCALDAGGRTVYWLQGVTPAESVRFLESVIRRDGAASTSQQQRLQDAALKAAALHRETTADDLLERLADADTDSRLRRQARSLLGSARGARGFATLRRLLDRDRLPDTRRQLVGAIGQSGEAGVAEILRGVARSDDEPKVRAEAAYWLPQRGGARVFPDVLAIIEHDASDAVRQRAVQGLGRLPPADSAPVLIRLAQNSTSAVVKKEAVRALGRSTDPRAMAYLEELIRK